MTTAHIIAGNLTANQEDRVVSGMLLPFGEVGSTNLGRFEIPGPGIISIPPDVSVLMANADHDQLEPRARFLTTTETKAGVVAAFKIGKNPEGDDLLAAIEEGKRTGKPQALSVEVKGVVIKAGKAISGKLTGAAFVARGAFPSATLLAAAADTTVDLPAAPAPGADPVVTTATTTDEITDEQGITHKRTITRTTKVETDADGNTTTTITEESVIEEPDTSVPADTTTNKEAAVSGTATVPATLAAAAANLVTPDGQVDKTAARDVFAMIAGAMKGDPSSQTLLAALTDINVSGAGALPAAGVLQPNWLGEVWKQKTYNRRYIPLIGHGDIKAIDEKGFIVTSGTEPVQPWNGNKSALPSSGGTTSLLSATFQRWAWAADIAREFFDIPGNEEVIAAFLRLVANSYARVTDKWVLAQIVANATILAPAVYPTLDATRDYPVSIKKLIQGVDAVSADPIDDTPAFAVANALAWQEIIYAPKDALPEWLSLDFGITDQSGTADGKVHLVRGDIGIDDTSAVMVGAVDAAHVNELPGASPLNLSALDIANGGVDQATVGYTQFMADYAAAIVTVGVADV